MTIILILLLQNALVITAQPAVVNGVCIVASIEAGSK